MEDYEKRKDEKCQEFAATHNLEYRDVMNLMIWVEWAGNRKIVNDIINRMLYLG